jgi:homoserine kinase
MIPERICVGDAVFNIGNTGRLVLGLERGDRALIAAGLVDQIHQPLRASEYPESYKLVQAVKVLGALGATISGAGPSVLLWCDTAAAPAVAAAVSEHRPGWTVHETEFVSHGGAVLTRAG